MSSTVDQRSLGHLELPNELWKEILTYLLHGPQHENSNSGPLCSVSRLFRAISRPFFFRDVSLTQAEAPVSPPEGISVSEQEYSPFDPTFSPDALVTRSFIFLDLLRTFPDIAHLVKNLDIRLRFGTPYYSRFKSEDPDAVLPVVLPLLGKIECLSFGRDIRFNNSQGKVEWGNIPDSTQRALSSVFHLPSLHTLQFTSASIFPDPAAFCVSFAMLPSSRLRSLALTHWQVHELNHEPVAAAVHKCLLSEASPFDITNLTEFVVIGLTPSDHWICTVLDAQRTCNTLTAFHTLGIFDYGFTRALPYTMSLKRFTSISTVSFATYQHKQYRAPMILSVFQAIPQEVLQTIQSVTIFTHILKVETELPHLKVLNSKFNKQTMPLLREFRVAIVPILLKFSRRDEETLTFEQAKECVEENFLTAKEAGILVTEEVDRDPFPCDYW
ncbi:hypothetical protein DL96DRAFT_1581904 [Flagelloscypha sp. PMI_526]|nr:hypothetical protein DL96DRAFT_1581904 [Flagelloscypha sp. PMI_526]